MSVIPSEVEESRGESLKVILRIPSTSLRMTIHHSDFVIRHLVIRHFPAACFPIFCS
jgi:hypothetical protein